MVMTSLLEKTKISNIFTKPFILVQYRALIIIVRNKVKGKILILQS